MTLRNFVGKVLDAYGIFFASLIVFMVKLLDTPFGKSTRRVQVRYFLLDRLGTFQFQGQSWVGTSAQLRYMTKDRLIIESDLTEKLSNYRTRTSGVIWDVGACVGNFSILASSNFSKVYAFEPDGFTFSSLIKNIHSSGRDVLAFNFALSNTSLHVAKLFLASTTEAHAHHSLESPINYVGQYFDPALELPVLGLRADELIDLLKLDVPEFVKIDVDGMEFEILEGFGRYLSDPRMLVVVAEVSPQNPKLSKLVNLLESNGFVMEPKLDLVTDNLTFSKLT
jgi:FkbM family methyltransferase